MKDEEIIHLYLLDQCDHDCPLCCNKQYDINKVPTLTRQDMRNAKVFCLTGGEPFLLPMINDIAYGLRNHLLISNPEELKIYAYTSGTALLNYLKEGGSLKEFNGISFSPKNKEDIKSIEEILNTEKYFLQVDKLQSNRLYVFPEMKELAMSKVLNSLRNKENFTFIDREWQKKFKPNGGIFRLSAIRYKLIPAPAEAGSTLA